MTKNWLEEILSGADAAAEATKKFIREHWELYGPVTEQLADIMGNAPNIVKTHNEEKTMAYWNLDILKNPDRAALVVDTLRVLPGCRYDTSLTANYAPTHLRVPGICVRLVGLDKMKIGAVADFVRPIENLMIERERLAALPVPNSSASTGGDNERPFQGQGDDT